MLAAVEKPRIQCRYRDGQDRQCPLDALDSGHCCRLHPPE